MDRRFIVSLLLALVFPVLGEAEDWLQFRGPTGQGHSSAHHVPVEWSDAKNVAWKQAIPGKGWSSPVLCAGRVLLTSAVPIEGSQSSEVALVALCLNAASGDIMWTTELFVHAANETKVHTKNSHASPTPLVDGNRVYVHFGHQGTACLDLDGNVVWRNNEIRYVPVHGNGGTPILVDDVLVFSVDGAEQTFVVALERETGQQRWKTERGSQSLKKFSFSTPLLIEAGGRRQVISPASDMVCAYDAASGRELWRVRYDGYSVIPRPVFAHGLVYVCTGYNSPVLLAIDPGGEGDVTDSHVAWTVKKSVPHTPSLLVVGDELYMVSDNGVASCLDARSGEVHWQRRMGGGFSASPVFAEGRIYLQNESGEGTVIQAARQYQELAKNQLGERTLASYAVADGALFIRGGEHLFRIDAR